MAYLLVFIGGGIGAALRHGVNRVSLATFGPSFPLGTMIVNVVGSLAMGFLAAYFLMRTGSSQGLRLFLTTGILGGFTTFSAFSLDAALMWQKGEWSAFGTYVLGSVLVSIMALFLGMSVARVLS